MFILGDFENGTANANVGIEYLHGTFGFLIALYVDAGEDCVPGLILGQRPMWMS